MQRSEALLPEPDDPMMLITFPKIGAERHAFEHFVVAVLFGPDQGARSAPGAGIGRV